MPLIVGRRGRAWSGRVTLALLALLVAECSSAAPAAPGATGTPSAATPPAVGGTAAVPAAKGLATQPPATQPPAGGNADVCGLAAGADVATIVGMELADATTNAATMSCTFNFVPKDPAVPASGGYVTLQADPTNRDTSLAIARDFYPEGEDVSGIGERAYWAKNIGMLIFVKGIVYTVQVRVNESGSRQKEIATKIAQLVLTKV